MKIVKKNSIIGGFEYDSIQEVYCNTVLETEEGNQMAICMREDTIEFKAVGFDKWYRMNMQTGEVEEL